MSGTETFDAIVVGTGQGGKPLAGALVAAGRRTAIIETDRILGAAVLGMEGGEVATVLQVAMMGDLPWTALRDAAISHPTVSESLNNLFMTLDG